MPPHKATDYEVLFDCLERGMTSSETAEIMDCSPSTIERRIGQIQREQGILMRYRSLQSLQLTQLQAQVLEAITPEKISDAPLRDLVMAYKILKDHELTIEGKPTEFKGLVGYLVQLEKEELALAHQPGDIIEAAFTENKEIDPTAEDWKPNI